VQPTVFLLMLNGTELPFLYLIVIIQNTFSNLYLYSNNFLGKQIVFSCGSLYKVNTFASQQLSGIAVQTNNSNQNKPITPVKYSAIQNHTHMIILCFAFKIITNSVTSKVYHGGFFLLYCVVKAITP